ncbi:MAG TPA: TetR/AcrR family transcriptional regulator [Nocardioides sp.]|nr:TetR/AcrR family transcriptional regulator [Nocardioides sp.]
MPKVSDEYRTARRVEILDAAVRCVAREGFHKTTMAHVIAESGLSAGAVYGYFKGKPELIKAIATRALSGFAEVLESVASAPGPVTPVGGLRAVISEVERMTAESGGAFPKVVVHAWSEAARDEEIREVVRSNVDKVHRAWIDVLTRAEADGTVAPGDHTASARVLVGLMPGFLVQGLLLEEIDGASYVEGFEALTRPPDG